MYTSEHKWEEANIHIATSFSNYAAAWRDHSDFQSIYARALALEDEHNFASFVACCDLETLRPLAAPHCIQDATASGLWVYRSPAPPKRAQCGCALLR